MDESGFLPAKPIIELLKENGVKDWEPRVIYQLLELQHGVTKELLEDACEYAKHRGVNKIPTEISEQDVNLAVKNRDMLVPGNKVDPYPSKRSDQRLRSESQKPLPSIEPSTQLRLPKVGALIKENYLFGFADVDDQPPKQSETSLVDDSPTETKQYNVKKSSNQIPVLLGSYSESSSVNFG